jgi:hypothetical protein
MNESGVKIGRWCVVANKKILKNIKNLIGGGGTSFFFLFRFCLTATTLLDQTLNETKRNSFFFIFSSLSFSKTKMNLPAFCSQVFCSSSSLFFDSQEEVVRLSH